MIEINFFFQGNFQTDVNPGTNALLLYRKGMDIINYTQQDEYILDQIKFAVTFESNLEKVKKIVGSIKCIKIIGIIDYSRLPELYNSVDIVIFPSIDQEAFGLVNTEAMACGLPVVATDVGGVPEVIVNNETGLLVEPSNAKALTNALEYLIDNEPIRKKMGRKGRERVERYFTLDIHTENLIKIFNHVLMERI